jgi:hypothetical protein
MNTLIRPLIALAAFAAGAAARGDEIKVAVVVDFNSGAGRLVRPSADKPAYYFPITLGYGQSGHPEARLKDPPPTAQVQRMIARALFDQGYRVENSRNPPSLVFVLRWGLLAPGRRWEREQVSPLQQESMMVGGLGGGPGGGGFQPDMRALSSGLLDNARYSTGPSPGMLYLVAGDTLKDRGYNVTDPRNPRIQAILALASEPRYFIIIAAYDALDWFRHYDDWKHHRNPGDKSRVLWEEHMSTEMAGRDFADVLPALIAVGAPRFGRETRIPIVSTGSEVPEGRVEAGTPVRAPNR